MRRGPQEGGQRDVTIATFAGGHLATMVSARKERATPCYFLHTLKKLTLMYANVVEGGGGEDPFTMNVCLVSV